MLTQSKTVNNMRNCAQEVVASILGGSVVESGNPRLRLVRAMENQETSDRKIQQSDYDKPSWPMGLGREEERMGLSIPPLSNVQLDIVQVKAS